MGLGHIFLILGGIFSITAGSVFLTVLIPIARTKTFMENMGYNPKECFNKGDPSNLAAVYDYFKHTSGKTARGFLPIYDHSTEVIYKKINRDEFYKFCLRQLNWCRLHRENANHDYYIKILEEMEVE